MAQESFIWESATIVWFISKEVFPKIVKTRQFKQYNGNNFKADIFTYLNDEIFLNSALDPNVMWEKWKTRFLTVADFHAPPITKRVRSQYAPLITNNIRQVMRQRDYF
jgi:hypothetical protein